MMTPRHSRSRSARPRSIGFFAPAGYLPDPTTADRAAAFFAQRGWRVTAGETVFAREQRFAGSDDLRAAELQRFATDRALDIALCARGGYGLLRILDRLDYEAIARARRIVVGYSDFTAFNLALLARAGAVSYQGPSAADFVAPDDFTTGHFFGALENRDYALDFAADAATVTVKGTLWGGNLALVCALLATPWFPRIRGGILFLEDVNEPAYRIERMLLQLLHAGVLARQRALLIGAFDPITPMPNDNGFDLDAVLARLRSIIDVPVITGLPFGHVAHKATLPVGASAELAVRGGRARLAFSGHPTLRAA